MVYPHRRRQIPDDVRATAAGIDDEAKTVNTQIAATATTLAFDGSASGSIVAPTQTPPPVITNTNPPLATTSAVETSGPTTASASSKSIAMSTVIGACVGALIGAGAFILLAFWFYRRYNQSLERKARRGAHARNLRAEQDRRRSKAEPWNALPDGDTEDKWEGMNHTDRAPVTRDVKEMDTFAPSAALAAYNNRSQSNTSNYQAPDKSPSSSSFQMNHPYASATPAPVAPQRVPEARDLLGREPHNLLGQIDSGPPISWDSDSKSSLLSATRLSGGAMSPTLNMAIPTPPATTSQPQLHRWESAEVLNYAEPHVAEVVDRPMSNLHNPFFSAADKYVVHKRNVSNSPPGHVRSDSASTIQPSDKKEKERVVSIDPFRDPLPKPSFVHHLPSNSASSSASNDRAIRQLVAAASLDDLSEDEVARRLRVASMQPSIISHSGDSMYTDAEPDPEDEAMMRSFPVPPSSTGHETAHTDHHQYK